MPVEKFCEICNRSIFVKPSVKRRFCSLLCKGAFQTSQKLKPYKCVQCGGGYYATPKDAPTQKFCSVECRIKSKRLGGQKWCNKGKHFVDLSNFTKSKNNICGFESYCKDCRKEHREEKADHYKEYDKNQDKQSIKEQSRRYYISTAKKQAEKSRRYYFENKDQIKKQRKKYYENNKEIFTTARHLRKARIKNAKGKFTKVQWIAKLEFYGFCCYLCGKNLAPKDTHLEHRIPISRGGSNWIANIAPACQRCNLTKNNKTEKEFRKVMSRS